MTTRFTTRTPRLLVVLAAVAATPVSAAPPASPVKPTPPRAAATAPAPVSPALATARALSSLARQAADNCGDACASLAVDVWRLRKRVASTEELRSLAVQVEEGDEACLCGRTHAQLPEIERQSQLLAEATVLFHFVGDTTSRDHNLARLRNVAHNNPDTPAALELLVRITALLAGPDAAVRDLAGTADDALRLHLLASAARSDALPVETRRQLLGEAMRAYTANPAGLRPAGAPAFVLALQDAARPDDAARVLAGLPKDEADRVTRTVQLLRTARAAAGQPRRPSPAADPALRALDQGDLRTAAALLDRLTGDTAPYDAALTARLTARTSPARALELAPLLKSPPLRTAFAAAAGLELTQSSDRVKYEDLFATHPWTE